MDNRLFFPFESDREYTLKLLAIGYAYTQGSRIDPSDFDMHNDNFGRILCNVYACEPILDGIEKTTPAQRTARIALDYLEAYNTARTAYGREPLPVSALTHEELGIRAAMSQYATEDEAAAVVEAIHQMTADDPEE